MHYLEATFRTAIRNKGFKEPLNVQFVSQKENQKVFLVCRDGYNLAKDLYNLGLTGITRYKDHERFFVCVEFCDGVNRLREIMETCTAIQSRRKTQLIREYSRGAIDCSQYENFADDLNFIGFWSSTLNDFWGMASGDEWNTDKCEGLKTCTEIQSRRYDNLLTENNRFPELVTLLIKHGFDPITFDEVYCVDSFDSCL